MMGFVAVLVGLAVRWITLRQLFIGAALLAIALVVTWLIGGDQASGVQRTMAGVADVLRNGIPTDASTSERFQMYEGAYRAFLASPLVGHGPFAFIEAAGSRATVPFEYATHLHSDLANFAASGGVLGLFAYGMFLLTPLVEALRTRDREKRKGLVLVSATLVVGFFVMGLTNAMFGILNLTVFYAAATLVVVRVGRSETDVPRMAEVLRS